ncbi:MAG: hypothetical protein RL621_1291 [Bacteroidota bacterium]
MNLKGIMQTLGVKPGQVVSNPYVRAFAPQVETIVKEEEDHEVSMAQNSLDTIIKMATELKAKMGENEKDIPAWIQDHITNAENFISQASSNYHEYGTNESINEEEIKWNAVENAIINFLKMNTKILDKRVKDRDTDGVKGGLKSIISGLTNAQRSLKLESLNEEFKHIISVETPTQVVSKPIAAQIEKLARQGVRSKEIGLKMGFVGNQKAATDAFQKLKNQIYFKLNKNESINEAFEVHYSDGMRAAKKFGNERQAVQFAKDLIKTKKGLQFVDVFNAGSGFHSTADTDKIVAWWGKGSYTDNKSKSDSKLASKKIKEDVSEARLTDVVNSIVETPIIGKVVGSKLSEAKKYDIGAGYMGNGLTIWNRAEQEHGDYRIIAHIDPYGKISIRDKQIPSNIMTMIKDWADALKKGDK